MLMKQPFFVFSKKKVKIGIGLFLQGGYNR